MRQKIIGENEFLYDGTNKGYYLPLTSRGGQWSGIPAQYGEGNILEEPGEAGLGDFLPWIHLLKILEVGFCKIGWKFRSPILETDWGRRLITYILSDLKNVPPEFFGFRAETTEATRPFLNAGVININSSGASGPQTVVVFNDDTNDPNFDADNYYTPTLPGFPPVFTSRAQNMNGLYTFKVTVNVEILQPVSVYLVLNEDINFFSIMEGVWFSGRFNLAPGIHTLTHTFSNIPTVVTGTYTLLLKFQDPITGNMADYGNLLEGSTIEGIPESVQFREGMSISINKLIDCDLYLIDILEAAVHLVGKGNLLTDHLNKTVTLFQRDPTQLWDGSVPESFYKQDKKSQIVLSENVVCNEQVSTLKTRAEDRFCRIRFQESSDEYIETNGLEVQNPLWSKTVDFGTDRGLKEDIKDDENPLFEPTAMIRDFSLDRNNGSGNPDDIDFVNGVVEIPALWDNDDRKISTKIGPRIALAAGMVFQYRGMTADGISVLRSNWLLRHTYDADGNLSQTFNYDEVPYAYQCTTDTFLSIPNDENSQYQIEDNVAYGDKPMDLFSLLWRTYINELNKGFTLDVKALIDICLYDTIDFRRLWILDLEGEKILAKLLEIDGFKACSQGEAILSFLPAVFDEERLCITGLPGICDNTPRLVIDRSDLAANQCITINNDNSQINSPILSDVVEYSVIDPNNPGNYLIGPVLIIPPTTLCGCQIAETMEIIFTCVPVERFPFGQGLFDMGLGLRLQTCNPSDRWDLLTGTYPNNGNANAFPPISNQLNVLEIVDPADVAANGGVIRIFATFTTPTGLGVLSHSFDIIYTGNGSQPFTCNQVFTQTNTLPINPVEYYDLEIRRQTMYADGCDSTDITIIVDDLN